MNSYSLVQILLRYIFAKNCVNTIANTINDILFMLLYKSKYFFKNYVQTNKRHNSSKISRKMTVTLVLQIMYVA